MSFNKDNVILPLVVSRTDIQDTGLVTDAKRLTDDQLEQIASYVSAQMIKNGDYEKNIKLGVKQFFDNIDSLRKAN